MDERPWLVKKQPDEIRKIVEGVQQELQGGQSQYRVQRPPVQAPPMGWGAQQNMQMPAGYQGYPQGAPMMQQMPRAPGPMQPPMQQPLPVPPGMVPPGMQQKMMPQMPVKKKIEPSKKKKRLLYFLLGLLVVTSLAAMGTIIYFVTHYV